MEKHSVTGTDKMQEVSRFYIHVQFCFKIIYISLCLEVWEWFTKYNFNYSDLPVDVPHKIARVYGKQNDILFDLFKKKLFCFAGCSRWFRKFHSQNLGILQTR